MKKVILGLVFILMTLLLSCEKEEDICYSCIQTIIITKGSSHGIDTMIDTTYAQLNTFCDVDNYAFNTRLIQYEKDNTESYYLYSDFDGFCYIETITRCNITK